MNMKQDEAKNYIVSEFLRLADNERTETNAAVMSLKYSTPDSKYYFKYRGDNYQAIMGWLSPHVLKK